ncbi:hypothetical protein HDU87_003866 [Geranomyces variabilis]|uniref:Uncharacterized protein n=1 Tax=Geranomyces variabilis TaxID=109894 RepID=A0AAD5XR08_9FUNG|nr:hypothetical protein HDU87_003866 [Geranomyces variabilis]
MPSFASLLFALAAATHASAHMMVSSPAVWGLVDELENPLGANDPNWLCHGKKYDPARPVLSLTPGGKLGLPITCGAASSHPENGKQICGNDPSAIHGGGGCILSIAPTHNPKAEDFIVISSVHDCPTLDFGTINFNLPDLPACTDCTCQWNWISDVAADESYSNCFSCSVNGKNGTISGGKHTPYYAVPGYPTKSPKPIYKTVFPDGAIPVNVTLAAAAATAVNVSSISTTNSTLSSSAIASRTTSLASAAARATAAPSSLSTAWTTSSTRAAGPRATSATGAQSSAGRTAAGLAAALAASVIGAAALAL